MLLIAHQNKMFSMTLGITSQLDFVQAEFLINLSFKASDIQNAVYPHENKIKEKSLSYICFSVHLPVIKNIFDENNEI